jgi:hypothetical protein
MIRWFIHLIYGSTPLELESAYPLEESVARLAAASRRSMFSALAEEAAVGVVTASRVRLQRVIPMVGNSFKPFFIGQFVTRNNRVYLTGRFTMLGFVKVFMSFWFGFLAVIAVVANATVLFSKPSNAGRAAFVLGPLGMFAAGIGLVRIGQWFSRNDAQWLTETMAHAIGRAASMPRPVKTATIGSAGGSSARPTIMTITAAVLAMMGAMNLVVAYSGLPVGAPSGKLMAQYLSPSALRLVVAAEGVLMMAIAGGVYARELWAWWAGFLLIGSAWIWSAVNFFALSDEAPIAFRAAFSLLGLVVMALWGRWWHAMRVHFRPRPS